MHARHGVADILGGEDGAYAREHAGCRHIDAANAAVRDGAAQDRRMEHAVAGKIVDKFTAAAQKAQVLQPLDGAADQGVDGSHGEAGSVCR